MSLTLIILAAGKGSRFGGNKPLAKVGPSGQSLFEYSIHDAFKAGFKHVIFVVNPEQNVCEYKQRLTSYNGQLKVEFVVQENTTGISSERKTECRRSKPWGTGHAVLICRDKVENLFAVINADDYYGFSNFKNIGDYILNNNQYPSTCALPGYRLKNTLSKAGGVNRGVCSTDTDGYLTSIHEVKNIHLKADNTLSNDSVEAGIVVTPDSIVSMTFWGFHPSFFTLLEREFQSFLGNTKDPAADEFYLPTAVNQALRRGEIKPRLIPTSEIWKGVTYAGDLHEVKKYILKLTDAGVYPVSI